MKRVCNHSITPMLCFVDPFFICGIRTTASIPAFQAGDAGSTPVYRSKNEPIRKINSATRCLSPIRKPLSMPGEVSGRINGRGSKARKTRSSLGISGSRSLNQRRARHRKCKVYILTSESLRSLLCRHGRVVDGCGLENRRGEVPLRVFESHYRRQTTVRKSNHIYVWCSQHRIVVFCLLFGCLSALPCGRLLAWLAQLVEHRSCNPKVAGSIPAPGPIAYLRVCLASNRPVTVESSWRRTSYLHSA